MSAADTTHVTTENTTDVATDATTDATTEHTTHVATDATTDATTEHTTHATTDVTTEHTTDTAADVTTDVPSTSRPTTPGPRDDLDRRIVSATLAQFDQRGLTGLRVAEVAADAGTTVAMLYRRFADREDLLVHALGSYYDDRYAQILAIVRSLLDIPAPISIDDIVAAVPPHRHEGSERTHQRMQRIYVAAVEFTGLRLALREVARHRIPEFESTIAEVVARLPESERFDPRILTVVLPRHNAIFDDLLGDLGLSNDDYREFLRSLMVNSARRRDRARGNDSTR